MNNQVKLDNGMVLNVGHFWSIYSGAFNIWYNMEPEQHKIKGVGTITTRTFLSQDPNPPYRAKRFVYVVGKDENDEWIERWFKVYKSGWIKEEFKDETSK